MKRTRAIVPVRLTIVVVALVAAAATIADSGRSQPSDIQPQDPAHVLEAAALAIGDFESGRVDTFDVSGAPNAFSPDRGFSEGDKLAFMHFIPINRDQNVICTVHGRADTGSLEFCANQDGGILIFPDAGFSEGDELAAGHLFGPEEGFDQVVIGRASTGEIEVWNSHPDPAITFEKLASEDVGFSAGDSIHIVDDFTGFGDEPDILVVNRSELEVGLYWYDADDEQVRGRTGPISLPYAFDEFAAGHINPLGHPSIVTVSAVNGAAAVFDFNAARDSGFDTPEDERLDEIEILHTGFGDSDRMLLADIHANLSKSILVANGDTGLVEVYAYTHDRNNPFHQVDPLVLDVSKGIEFAAHDLVLADTDGDGLKDIWEMQGLDANGDGQIDVDLPAKGADPLHKDLFIEYDWMRFNEPSQDAIDMVVEAFALAPIGAGGNDNPSGEIGINLHIDTGNLGGGNQLVDNTGSSWTLDICDLDHEVAGTVTYYEAKRINFDPLRSLVFRYGISAERCFNISPAGQGEIGGNDFVIYNAGAPQTITEASTLMHEIGHNLGLMHGGFQRDNCKPNYVSIMSYSIPAIERIDGSRIIDFSPPRIDESGNRGNAPLANLNEAALDENTPLDPSDPVNMFAFRDGNGVVDNWPLSEIVDWTGDGQHSDEPVAVNIDNIPTVQDPEEDQCLNDELTVLVGHDDWSNISLPFRHFGNSADGPLSPSHPHRTQDDIVEYLEELNSTDLEITKTADVSTVVAGEELNYTLTVTNNGPRRANAVQVVDSLPDGVTYEDNDANCSLANGDVVCDLGQLPDGESHEINITVVVDPDVVFNAGGATTITNSAAVTDVDEFGTELNSENASVEFDTEVVGESDLEVVELSGPDQTVDVLIDQPTELQLDLTLANHGPSGPTDVGLEIAAENASGIGVDLVDPAIIGALEVDEHRELPVTISVHCDAPGSHDISLTGSVTPATPDVSDPDETNNAGSAEITVECVIPVAINIMPGGFPNSINLGSGGVTPVGVLSTDEGEYDLPVTFDATTIDPTSVLFGRAENLFGTTDPSGAPAFQNRGHIEDVYELDQETKDGVLDMLLRFRTQETGLVESDTQACLRGEAEIGNERFTFFGCGEIVITP